MNLKQMKFGEVIRLENGDFLVCVNTRTYLAILPALWDLPKKEKDAAPVPDPEAEAEQAKEDMLGEEQ